MARYPFYELAARRSESDGSVRRCFRAADGSERVLFIWQVADAPLVHAQLLLDDEAYVEWRGARVTSGRTNRADDAPALHPRHKGVRTLEAQRDAALIVLAGAVLQDSDLPPAVVGPLLACLPPA